MSCFRLTPVWGVSCFALPVLAGHAAWPACQNVFPFAIVAINGNGEIMTRVLLTKLKL